MKTIKTILVAGVLAQLTLSSAVSADDKSTVKLDVKAGFTKTLNQLSDVYGDQLPPEIASRLGTIRFRPDEGISSARFTSNGKQVLVASGKALVLCDMETGKVIRTFETHTYSLGDFSFSPYGEKVIATVLHSGKNRLVQVESLLDLSIEKGI